MNIVGYIKQNKEASYLELPFNDVDGLIFSELAYINFDLLVKDKKELKLSNIKDEELTDEVFEGSVDYKKNKVMLSLMKEAPRYKDIKIRYVKRYFSKKEINQFLAMTLVLPDGTLFLSYRGTDTTLIGWKEDMYLAFNDTILAQEQALTYANYALRGKDTPFILAGHSKGGNLAFYTALNISKEKLPNLIKAYSYDGPGFKDGIVNFPNYRQVVGKMVKFKTYNDVVGNFFANLRKYKVVRSPGLLFGGHDPFYWQVNPRTNDYRYAKDISRGSKKYSKRVMRWVESLTYEDRELVTDALFAVFGKNATVYDLYRNFVRNLRDLKKVMKRYTKRERKRLKAILKRLVGFIFNTKSVRGIKRKQAILEIEMMSKKEKKEKLDTE